MYISTLGNACIFNNSYFTFIPNKITLILCAPLWKYNVRPRLRQARPLILYTPGLFRLTREKVKTGASEFRKFASSVHKLTHRIKFPDLFITAIYRFAWNWIDPEFTVNSCKERQCHLVIDLTEQPAGRPELSWIISFTLEFSCLSNCSVSWQGGDEHVFRITFKLLMICFFR